MYLLFYLLAFTSCLVVSETAAINDKQVRNLNRCNELGDCLVESVTCEGICPCDMPYTYLEETNECVIDLKKLMSTMQTKYNNEEKIRRDAEKTFRGILVSALFFIICALLCVLTSCVYCCHMNYTDRKLKNEVEALCKKMGKDKERLLKPTKSKTEPKAESCNVVVGEAGLYCV